MYFNNTHINGLEKLSRYSDSLRTGRCEDRIPVGGDIFRNHPERTWVPPILLHNRYRGIPGGKAAEALG